MSGLSVRVIVCWLMVIAYAGLGPPLGGGGEVGRVLAPGAGLPGVCLLMS